MGGVAKRVAAYKAPVQQTTQATSTAPSRKNTRSLKGAVRAGIIKKGVSSDNKQTLG